MHRELCCGTSLSQQSDRIPTGKITAARNVVDIFSDRDAVIRLVGASQAEQQVSGTGTALSA
jgi:hypothetical protein